MMQSAVTHWSGRLLPLLAVCLMVSLGAAGAQAQVTISVYPSLSPNVYGSPSWSTYGSNAINALKNGFSSYGTPDTPGYYQQLPNGSKLPINDLIVTGFPSWHGDANPGTDFGPQYANEFGNRPLFGVVINDTGGTFTISQLSFVMGSTDPGNSLGWSYPSTSFSSNSYGYGTVWEGLDTSDNWITSGDSTPLKELIGVGHGNAYAVYSSDPGTTNQDKINNALAGITGPFPFDFYGTYTLVGPNQSILATGNGDVQVTPEPGTLSMLAGLGLSTFGFAFRRRWIKAS